MLFTEVDFESSVFERVVAPKPSQTSSPVLLSSHADVLWGSSRVPAPRTSPEPKDEFLSHCSQISAGDHSRCC